MTSADTDVVYVCPPLPISEIGLYVSINAIRIDSFRNECDEWRAASFTDTLCIKENMLKYLSGMFDECEIEPVGKSL